MEEKDIKNLEDKDVIDLREVGERIWIKKKSIALTMLITGIIAAIIIVLVPRTYKSEVTLAPEAENSSLGDGTLGSLASSFGFDLGSMQSADAIYPLLYPDKIKSNDFIVDLFKIKVKTLDGSIYTDYYTYLCNNQKSAPWSYLFNVIKSIFKNDDKNIAKKDKNGNEIINPFMLTKRQEQIVKGVKNKIKCDVDKKTNVVSIIVSDQDPLIAATMADSVRRHLQDFITKYRTNKAKKDFEYYSRLTKEAKKDYLKATREYSVYVETHQDLFMQSSISKKEDLENEMQLKFNAYNMLNSQMQAAKVKIQDKTPAFTVLQSATVPNKADSPKRMLFVIGMMILVFIILVIYYSRDIFLKLDINNSNNN